MIKKHDKLRILPQWQDDGDEDIVFVALEDEAGERVLIEARLDMPIRPTQVVQTAWVTKETA